MSSKNRYLFKLAWKNILRHKSRSFFISFSVSISIGIAVWIMALFDGMNKQIEDSVVAGNVGHFQIQEKNFSMKADGTTPKNLDAKILEKLKKLEIEIYSPELVLDSFASGPEGSLSLVTLGIDPKLNDKFMNLSSHLKSGRWFESPDDDGIVIGEELSLFFHLNVGDSIILNFQDEAGGLREELIPIIGIFSKNGKSFEKKFNYITHKKFKQLYFNKTNYDQNIFHRIVIRDNLKNTDSINDEFIDSQLEIKTWKNINPEMAVILEFHDGIINFFFLIISLSIGVTIFTPVSLLWQERRFELKMMRTIGMMKSTIWKTGLFEACQMIIFSFISSSIITMTAISITHKTGVNFRLLEDGIIVERAGIQLPRIVYPLVTSGQVIAIFFMILTTITLAYLLSIRGVLRRVDN
jgi:putative ABC transport system permease protein